MKGKNLSYLHLKAVLKRLEYLALRILVSLVWLLPFWLFYLCADILFFILFYLLKYRKAVIFQNLQKAFPEKPANEIAEIMRQYYKNLADVILEGLKGLSMNTATLKKRYIFKNPEILNAHLEQGNSVILLGNHIANWEWGVISFPLWVSYPAIGIYKPLSNKLVEDYLNKKRMQCGMILYPMSHLGRAMIAYKTKPGIFILIADQTPSDIGNADWINFLHQDTPFLHGPGKLAKKTNFPIYLIDIQRIRRGYYEVGFQRLCMEPAKLEARQITETYTAQLEKLIRQQPANWLWSHRRWKHSREVKK